MSALQTTPNPHLTAYAPNGQPCESLLEWAWLTGCIDKLPPIQRLVLIELVWHAERQRPWPPTASDVAESLSLSQRAVRSALKALTEHGYAQQKPHHGKATTYHLTPPNRAVRP